MLMDIICELHGAVIAVDFDETLYLGSYDNFPEVDVKFLNEPLIKAIEAAQLSRPQDKYVLYTCREGSEVAIALKALNEATSIKWDTVNHNIPVVAETFSDSRKILADIYIDDKALKPSEGVDYLKNLIYSQSEVTE